LLIDTTATAHPPGPQNLGECRLYDRGDISSIALTRVRRRIIPNMESIFKNAERPHFDSKFFAPRPVF